MVDVLCAWSHDTNRPGIRYQCHKVKKMTAFFHQCASWISVESVPIIHLQFKSQSTCIFTVISLKSSRLCTTPYQHMINFTCVLQCTSQDKTSWIWRFKFQESYGMEGTCFHQICSVLQIPENRTYLMKTGTFHFIKFLKLKKFIMLVKEPLSRSS